MNIAVAPLRSKILDDLRHDEAALPLRRVGSATVASSVIAAVLWLLCMAMNLRRADQITA